TFCKAGCSIRQRLGSSSWNGIQVALGILRRDAWWCLEKPRLSVIYEDKFSGFTFMSSANYTVKWKMTGI
ncbi:MAG: hypothetical protein ACRCU5_13735, partial [Rhizobiaceae bacterium]